MYTFRKLGPWLLCLAILSGCEKVSPYLDSVKKALDRETSAETEKAEQIALEDIPPPPKPVKMEPVINKEARVSVLGYHDFTEGKSSNDMILNIDDFRAQMQAIKDAELPVISMREFLDWKQGKADIPAQCMMITIDDGWKATHTLAMSVLKEYGYPFTIFLYKNYVGVGGRSMTHDEIRELVSAGATISSHSVSHQNMKLRRGKSEEEYHEWLRVELEDSYKFLQENFGDTGAVVPTFAYPYGYWNDETTEMAKDLGYEACFTVNGSKTTWDEDEMLIGRYIVHGTTLANFDPALNFGGGNVTSTARKLLTESKDESGEEQAPLVTVLPPANATIGNRLPLIEVNLSKLQGVQPDSITMRISGFGKVPVSYDPTSGIASYQIPQRLRTDSVGVQVGFRHAGNTNVEVVGWTFSIDLMEDYLSSDATQPGKNAPVDEPAKSRSAASESTKASSVAQPTASL